MTFSRLRMWLFFNNLFNYLIISTFSHTGMIIDGNVLIKMGIKPIFPIRQFLKCLRIVFEGVNHGLLASLCGRVEGVERTTSRSRKWANFNINIYDYFVAKDHIAIYLRRPTRERVTTILTGFRSARIMCHYRHRFSAWRHSRWSKLPKPCNSTRKIWNLC